MPGWVSFTPTIPTKVGQFSTDVDIYFQETGAVAGIEPARLAAGDFESVIYSVSTGK